MGCAVSTTTHPAWRVAWQYVEAGAATGFGAFGADGLEAALPAVALVAPAYTVRVIVTPRTTANLSSDATGPRQP